MHLGRIPIKTVIISSPSVRKLQSYPEPQQASGDYVLQHLVLPNLWLKLGDTDTVFRGGKLPVQMGLNIS